jgi:S-layer homology domain
MLNSKSMQSGTALLVALGLAPGLVAPMVITAPASAQTAFPDVSPNYWAAPFINQLAARGVIAGFDDGRFRPEQPVTRAQFAAMINRAFPGRPATRPSINFVDVPANFWGRGGIDRAYTTGFMAGYPGNVFRPDENIPRGQILVSLTSGLGYAPAAAIDSTLGVFSDASQILPYARSGVAAATERRLVVNYPNVRLLNPNQVATRAEVAALIYQSLVSTGQVAAIPSQYIVGGGVAPIGVRIPAGTALPVRYDGVDKVLLSKDEAPTPFSMRIAQNVITSQGQVLIPAGSEVVGQLRTTPQGAQFTAGEIVLPGGRRLPVNGASTFITRTESINRGSSTGKVIAGTLVGAGAAAGIAAVTGDRTIKAWEVLPGAVVGAAASLLIGSNRVELYAINPNTDLNLILNSDLVIQ